MREIIFRGKRIVDGEWVYGVYMAHDHDGHTIFNQNLEDGTLQGFEVIPETVGQYTGLKDKNGKKIFEGDVIKTEKGIIQVVVYNENYCAFVAETNGSDRLYQIAISDEVIGNIHDGVED